MEASSKNYLTAGIITAGVVLSTWILGNSIVRARSGSEEIRVTGSARKEIISDSIAWTGNISYRGQQLDQVVNSVKSGVGKLKDYLRTKGVKETDIITNAMQTQNMLEPLKNETSDAYRQVIGYQVSQSVTVRSNDVDGIEKISRESTDLISQGVSLESGSPLFYFTKIGDVKREILGLAAEDAKKRAEEIASKSGANLGGVKSVRMAPLQITPKFDFEIYSSGYNDLSSKEKAITAVVTVAFGTR